MQQTMLAIDQKVKDFAIHVGLNNIIARDTSPKVGESAPMENGSPSRRAQTPTERVKYQLWPNLRKADAVLRSQTPDISEIRQSPFREGAPNTRRKISVPELGNPKAASQKSLDSPTIPGRFPLHERSNSAPGTSGERRICVNTSMAPITELSPPIAEVRTKKLEPSPLADGGKSHIRYPGHPGESRTKQEGGQASQGSRAGHKAGSSLESLQEMADVPPEVPPKSPNLATKPLNGHSRTATCENIATQKSTTAVKRDIGLNIGYHGSAPDATETQCRAPTPENVELFAPWVNPSSRNGSPSKKQARYAAGNSQTDVSYSIPKNQTPSGGHHKRDKSEDSIMNRGRPKKKRLPQEQVPIHERHEIPDITNRALPLGTPVHMASMTLPCAEVEKLQNQARGQADRFEVLKHREVRTLSKELHVLDKRCEYLRETHNSLRAGRRSLHARMISCLRSSRSSKFSIDGILRQEEALAELDQSIDEWYTKLEHAENRRARIRQKLLEHLAAVLVLGQPAPGSKRTEEQTPPRSPQETDSPDGGRREIVESIKIYADAELQALFANVEKEMEKMVNSDQRGSPSPTTQSPNG